MDEDIYSNPLNDINDNNEEYANSSETTPKSSFLASKDVIKKSFSNNSSTSSASNKSKNSDISSNSNNNKDNNENNENNRNYNQDNNNTNNSKTDNNSNTNNNTDNNTDRDDDIYSKLKLKAVQSDSGDTEYVYSVIDKEKKKNKNNNNNNNNNDNFNDAYDSSSSSRNNSNKSKNDSYKDDNNTNNNNNNINNNNNNINNNNNNINNNSDVYDHIPELMIEEEKKTEDFYTVFLGSMLVDMKRLKANKVSYVEECIRSVAGLTSATTTLAKTCNKDKKVTLSENRGMTVVMRIEDGCLRVMERGSNLTRLRISLPHIRMWGVGKEKKSRELAIISKDEEIQNVLCRVFLCEREASQIAKCFYEVCQKMVLKRNIKVGAADNGTTSSNESNGSRLSLFIGRKSSFKKDGKNDEKIDGDKYKKRDETKEERNEETKESNRKSITQHTLPMTQKKTVKIDETPCTIRTTLSDGYRSSFYSSTNNEIDSFYLGMMEVQKQNGLKTLEHAIDMVKRYVAEETWLDGALKCSQSGVYFLLNSIKKLTCSTPDITFTGLSLKYRSFLGVMVTRNKKNFVHVFSIKGDAIGWFETMKFVGHLHSSKYPKTDSTLKKWK